MAREQLMAEYEVRREQIHKKWQVENEQAWKTSRTFLPYPEEMLEFPTDGEIITRAKLIQDFIEQQEQGHDTAALTENRQPEPEHILNQPMEESTHTPEVAEPPADNDHAKEEPVAEEAVKAEPESEQPQPDPEPKSPDWVRDPAAMQEYAATMARAKMDDESSTTAKILPDLVKTLEQMRLNWQRN